MINPRKGGILTFLLLVCLLLWYCREKPVVNNEVKKEVLVESVNPKIIIDLCNFAGVSITDTTDIEPMLRFKLIDSSAVPQDIKIEEAVRLFNRIRKGKNIAEIPLMEFKTTDKTLLMFNGRGYAGPIWATVLLNNKNQQIEKISFEHRAESEDYASGLTIDSFENQFTGVEIKNDIALFVLKQENIPAQEGRLEIDGLSGATVSSQGVVNMLNLGIQFYTESLKVKKE